MNQLIAIVFSLLLIGAPSFALPASVGGSDESAKPGCDCGRGCCVDESSVPVVPPLESTPPTLSHSQMVFVPPAAELFAFAALRPGLSFASVPPEFRTACAPLFLRNCVFLI